MQNKSWCYRNK